MHIRRMIPVAARKQSQILLQHPKLPLRLATAMNCHMSTMKSKSKASISVQQKEEIMVTMK